MLRGIGQAHKRLVVEKRVAHVRGAVLAADRQRQQRGHARDRRAHLAQRQLPGGEVALLFSRRQRRAGLGQPRGVHMAPRQFHALLLLAGAHLHSGCFFLLPGHFPRGHQAARRQSAD